MAVTKKKKGKSQAKEDVILLKPCRVRGIERVPGASVTVRTEQADKLVQMGIAKREKLHVGWSTSKEPEKSEETSESSGADQGEDLDSKTHDDEEKD